MIRTRIFVLSPLRLCETLEFPIDLVQIKGLRIKLAPNPFHHLLVLGVLWLSYGLQQAHVPLDAPTILGRTGAFAREADGVVLRLFQWQSLFDEHLVFPAIPKVILIEELVFFALPQGR